MKTIILGMGKSGRAAFDLLKEEGDVVVGVDDHLQMGTEVDVTSFDRLILSPGIAPTHPLILQAKAQALPVIGEADLALSRMHKLQHIIAITGTNGKTTVTLLITHILQEAGLKARALGNVGIPLSSYIIKADRSEIAVVELSSYQLETLSAPYFEIGVILNITPDHLDRYRTVEAYAKAKCRLKESVKKKEQFWVHESVATQFKGLLKQPQIYGSNPSCILWTNRVALCRSSRVELMLPIRYRNLGVHESENILAAWIVCHHFGVLPEAFLRGLETFERLPHRIEKVASIRGVDYVNDSKGTNVDATIKAVESMEKPITLIVGGVDKGASYEGWKISFKGRVQHILALGQAAKKIAADLKPEYQVEIFPSLREAVFRAQLLSKEGDVVLLSPGCASFDMFRDYAHRGDEFKKIIKEVER